jgi:hypothetical protein
VSRDQQKAYAFEEALDGARVPPRSHRTHDDAARALAVLRTRLAIPDGSRLEHDLERDLLRYCTDVVLNVLWYERARRREESKNTYMTALVVALMLVALVLLFVSNFVPVRQGAAASQGAMLQLTLFAGGALTVLQVIAALGDGKARLTIFWKASADLKEALYTFERTWCGRCTAPLDEVAAPSGKTAQVLGPAPGFADALEDVLRLARGVTRAERVDFFATLRSPSDIVAIATTAAASLRGQRAEVTAVLAKHDDGVAEARTAVVLARAAIAASEFRLAALTDAAEKRAEERTLLDARAETIRAEKVLRELSPA